jgi:hypothetical protein
MNEKNKHFDKDEHSLSSFNMCIINNTLNTSWTCICFIIFDMLIFFSFFFWILDFFFTCPIEIYCWVLTRSNFWGFDCHPIVMYIWKKKYERLSLLVLFIIHILNAETIEQVKKKSRIQKKKEKKISMSNIIKQIHVQEVLRSQCIAGWHKMIKWCVCVSHAIQKCCYIIT